MKISIIFLILLAIISACSPAPALVLTPNPTVTPTSTPTPIPTATVTPTPIHRKGIVVKHQPDGDTKFPWFSYLPNNIDKKDNVFILLDAASGQGSCEVNEAAYSAEEQTKYYASYAEEWKYVLLFPAIPRDCSRGDNWNYYFGKFDVWGTHLDSSIFTSDPEDHNYRFDQRIIFMIEELKNELRHDGYSVNEKIYLMGYSTGGNFANRLALLHPEKVKAVGVGGLSGIISLPITDFQGKTYNWYNGIADYEDLLYKPFDELSYSEIAQYYFWGELDDSDHCPSSGVYCFSSNPVESNRIACDYLKNLGYDIACKEYEGIGHEFTEQMHQDVFSFFEKHK